LIFYQKKIFHMNKRISLIAVMSVMGVASQSAKARWVLEEEEAHPASPVPWSPAHSTEGDLAMEID
jgi:hypothetical protein